MQDGKKDSTKIYLARIEDYTELCISIHLLFSIKSDQKIKMKAIIIIWENIILEIQAALDCPQSKEVGS